MYRFKEVLSRIAAADSQELSHIVQAVLDRYSALFPEEEVLFLSLPLSNHEERAAILRKAAKMNDWYE